MTKAPASYCIDITQAEFDEHGLKDFFWPLSRMANSPVREYLLTTVPELLNSSEHRNTRTAKSVQLFFKWFLIHTMNWYEAVALNRLIAESGTSPAIPKHFQMLRALQDDKWSEPFFQELATGVKFRRPLFPGFVRRWVQEYRWNGLDLTTFVPWISRRKNMCSSPSQLTLDHARSKDIYLHFNHYANWFQSIVVTDLDRETPDDPDAEEETVNILIALVAKAFAAGCETMPKSVDGALRTWLRRSERFASIHLERLDLRRKELPKTFWTGSPGASIWTRLFAHAVRRNGGRVIGHDHGFGDVHHQQLTHLITEFNDCDIYCTYNETHAAGKGKNTRPELQWDGDPPELTWIAGSFPKLQIPTNDGHLDHPIRRLMYVPTAFHGEGTRLRPTLSDSVYMDWQARLLSFLRDQGIEVLYKPHPDLPKLPGGFAEYFGFQTFSNQFEDLTVEVDAYLIDFVSSSTTAQILSSPVPVIFCDPGYPEVLPEALELLEKRCYRIPMAEGEDHRMMADWNRISEILLKPSHTFDYTFTRRYFSNLE